VLVACALGVVQFSFAQKLEEVGLRGGLNSSSLNLSQGGKLSGTNYHSAVGYHVGGYALIKLNKKIFFSHFECMSKLYLRVMIF